MLKGTGRILIMDDDESVREIVGEMLTILGYDTDFASDGSETIEKYEKAISSGEEFDLVLMDLTIAGGMGGKDTQKKLLRLHPNIKTIVSSGYSNDPIMSDFRQYGFKGVITKPFRIDELSEIIHKVLENK